MARTVSARIESGIPIVLFPDGRRSTASDGAIAEAVRVEPGLRPAPLGLEPSFGFGDRLGLATVGHAASLGAAGTGIRPIFAQQSIREMTRTGRSPREVMDDATLGVLLSGYSGPMGADADHLKTPEDVDRTAAAGFCFFTIDPSAHVDGEADNYSQAQVDQKFAAIKGEAAWLSRYEGKRIKLATGTALELSTAVCRKAAVKYARAINHAVSLSDHIAKVMNGTGRSFEIELSVDETPQPTTLAEHWIIADQCLSRNMRLVSLAPRFVGDFEKGVDFKGDITAFEKSLADHAAIASDLGPYKLSLHSGSDKLSIYGLFARHTRGRFHVKTAGTSYLEALRAVARHDESLFRAIINFARTRYDTDKATYHVSATLGGTPPPSDISDLHALEGIYLGHWKENPAGTGLSQPGRQILHCTFGSVLMDLKLGLAVRQVIVEHRQTYEDILVDHFSRHLRALAYV